jgi:hypothetical protein
MWLTPTDSDANGIRDLDGQRSGGLNTQVMLWPTPTSTAGDGRSEQSVEMWTARRERTLREKGIHNGIPLNVAVKMWPTPQARDYRSPDDPDGPRATRKQAQGWSPNLNDLVVGKLNPEWVETLMGYPEGWTEIAESTTSRRRVTPGQPGQGKRSTHGSRRARRTSASPTAQHA